MDNLMSDVANIQSEYQKLIGEKKLTKKNMCDLVVPFRDKYKLKDSEALQIARAELSVAEINDLLTRGSED